MVPIEEPMSERRHCICFALFCITTSILSKIIDIVYILITSVSHFSLFYCIFFAFPYPNYNVQQAKDPRRATISY
jgi:hypothetical protein